MKKGWKIFAITCAVFWQGLELFYVLQDLP